jgi:hypothetical protein
MSGNAPTPELGLKLLGRDADIDPYKPPARRLESF